MISCHTKLLSSCNWIIFSCLALVTLASSTLLQAQNQGFDHNNDGLTEFTLINILPNSDLSWNNYTSSGSLSTPAFVFGKAGDHLAPSFWTNANQAKPLVVRQNASRLDWILAGGNSLTFGTAKSTAVAGADIDGNGVSDPIIVNNKNLNLDWRIRANHFANGSSRARRVLFGATNEFPFYFRASVGKDFPATARNNRANTVITSYNLDNRKSRKFRVRKTNISEAPMPIRQENGSDLLALIDKSGSDTNVTFANTRGQIIRSTTLAGRGIIIIGDFLAGTNFPGQELAIQANSGFRVVNPNTGAQQNVSIPSGIPVDHLNINRFSPPPSNSPSPPIGNVPCKNEVLNPRDGAGGFLWKAVSDLHSAGRGNLAIHIPARFTNQVNSLQLFDANGNFLETGVFGGLGNPDRPLYRFSKRGASYPRNTRVIINVKGGCTTTYIIDTPSQRVD